MKIQTLICSAAMYMLTLCSCVKESPSLITTTEPTEESKASNGDKSPAVPHDGPYAEMIQDSLVVVLKNAGSLDSLCTGIAGTAVKSLAVCGPIDARDFNYIKWNFTAVENIDLSGSIVEAYTGIYGTNEGYEETYAAATIPEGAFFYWCSHYLRDFPNEFFDEGMPSLKSIKLPDGLVGIERNAFARAYNLTEINIPEGVTHIDYVSFRYCVSLKSIVLPASLSTIGLWAFTEMNALETVVCRATTPPSTNQSFGGVDDIEGARGWVNTGSHKSEIKATLFVPENSLDAYRASEWSGYFKDIKGISRE